MVESKSMSEAPREQPAALNGIRCCCGALAMGRTSDGEPRCCAACCFDPRGCRCKYGDPPNTPDDSLKDMEDLEDPENLRDSYD